MKRKKYIQKVDLPEINYRKIIVYGILFLLVYTFVANAIIKYFEVKNKYNSLQKKLFVLKQKNSELKKDLELIKNDPATIEYYVRKEFGYIKPGEKIYILKKSSDDKKSNEKNN